MEEKDGNRGEMKRPNLPSRPDIKKDPKSVLITREDGVREFVAVPTCDWWEFDTGMYTQCYKCLRRIRWRPNMRCDECNDRRQDKKKARRQRPSPSARHCCGLEPCRWASDEFDGHIMVPQ